MNHPTLLPSPHRAFAELVAQTAFANPFAPERATLDRGLMEQARELIPGAKGLSFADAVFEWVEWWGKAGLDRLGRVHADDLQVMRVVFLFDLFHRRLAHFDTLIAAQLEAGAAVAPVPFGAEALEDFARRGFGWEESVRLFSIFYQLRRAHHFVEKSLVGRSPVMVDFRRRLWNNVFTADTKWYSQVFHTRMEDFSTLLLGATGVGKGAAAAAIGRSGFIPYLPGQRRFADSFATSFISINLAQFPESLVEAELFGHRKGAFTGAIAAHEGVFAQCSPCGSIFLDEIGEVPSTIQVKLLQVLQERWFSPVGSRDKRRFQGRVISATNRPLASLLDPDGGFREDFFYRISSDVVTVPTLRMRLDQDSGELDMLARHVLTRLAGDFDPAMYVAILEKLHASPGPNYAWPGNVRELEQAIRRILLTGEYTPYERANPSGESHLQTRWRRLEFTAEGLLAEYVGHAKSVLGTLEETARRLDLDPRTVKKHLK